MLLSWAVTFVSSRSAPLALVVLFTGCSVDLDDRPGRTCDEGAGCRAPRVCVSGRCFGPGELSASDGGEPPDAGLPTPDAGPRPLWQQRVHGFSTVTEDSSCAAMIDPSRANQVTATVVSTRDTEDTASANVLDVARLPTGLSGRVRGRLTLASAPRLAGNAPFLELGSQPSSVHLQLALTARHQLEVNSMAMTVADTAVSNRYAIDGGFERGDYLFEVSWQRGGTRTVWLNGQRLGEVPLPSTRAAPPPDRLRLGIMRLDGVDGGPFSVTIGGWQLSDDPDAVLEDAP